MSLEQIRLNDYTVLVNANVIIPPPPLPFQQLCWVYKRRISFDSDLQTKRSCLCVCVCGTGTLDVFYCTKDMSCLVISVLDHYWLYEGGWVVNKLLSDLPCVLDKIFQPSTIIK